MTVGQTFRNFKTFTSSIEAIYLVEASGTLREVQKRLLCGEDAAMEETDIGHRSTCKYFDVPVIWVEDIRLLPHGELRNIIETIVTTTDNPENQRKERLPSSSRTNSSTRSPYTPSSLSPQPPRTKRHRKFRRS